MALATFSDLKTSLASWLNRDDLTSVIPDFITLFESRANKRLRTSHQETSATVTITDGSGTLPADYLEWRAVLSSGSPLIALEAASPDYAEEEYSGDGATAYPKVFTIIGTTIKTYPPSSNNLTLKYYAKITALSSDNTTNWLLTNYPDIYLYGSLLESAPFLGDDQRATAWGTYLEQAFSDLEKSEFKKKYARLGTKVSGPTP